MLWDNTLWYKHYMKPAPLSSYAENILTKWDTPCKREVNDKELVIGDGTHDSYISHKFKLHGIEFKTSDFIYLCCSGWSQVSPKKSTSSNHAVIFIEIAIYATSFFTYVFRLVSSITKKIYKHKSCSNFYRDCNLCKKLFLHVFLMVSSITKKIYKLNHAVIFIEIAI